MPLPDDVKALLNANKDKNNNTVNTTQQSQEHLNDFDFNANNNILNAARQSTGEGYMYDPEADEVKKYTDAGIVYNPNKALTSKLDYQLAQSQSGWAKIGSALSRTIVSELVLGTLKGFSDIVGAGLEKVGLKDDTYTNPVSQLFEDAQNSFNEKIAPIYRDPTKQDVSTGALGDVGWWAENFPSVASSAAMLLTTRGLNLGGNLLKTGAKMLAKSGKAAKTAGRVKQASKWASRMDKITENKIIKNTLYNPTFRKAAGNILKNAKDAAIMRVMENYQEGRQTYNEVYENATEAFAHMTEEEYNNVIANNKEYFDKNNIDTSDRDAVARAIAKRSADKTFGMDMWNGIFDFVELMALRNQFKGKGKVHQSALSKQREKFAKKMFGKYHTNDEFEALWKQRSKGTKVWDWAKRRGYGTSLAWWGQASEGIEEAWNYISSEEGVNVGKLMLGASDKDYYFLDRLLSYAKAPQLWESAFWGVGGGVVFQWAGSKFNYLDNAYNTKKENDKKFEENEKTGEKVDEKYKNSLWELPDEKRNKAEFARRIELIENYTARIQNIKEGKDPFNPESPERLTPEQQERLIEEETKNMAKDLTLLSLDGGRFDVVRSFMTDEHIIKALAEQGIFANEEEAKEFCNKVAEGMDNVQKIYNEEGTKINKLATSLNRKRFNAEKIPYEYLELIAKNNIDHRRNMSGAETAIAMLEDEIAELEKQMEDDPELKSLNAKQTIRLQHLTQRLSQLEAEKREIKDSGNSDSISSQVALAKIDKEIAFVKDKIFGLDEGNGLSNLLYAISNAAASKLIDVVDAEGKRKKQLTTDNTLEYMSIQSAIENKDIEAIKKLDEKFAQAGESMFAQLDVIHSNVRGLFEGNTTEASDVNKIRSKSEELWSLYNGLADAENARDAEKAQMVNDEEDLTREVNSLHNGLNQLRRESIKQAHEELIDLLEETAGKLMEEDSSLSRKRALEQAYNKLFNYINNRYFDNGEYTDTVDASFEKRINSALDILNFVADVNKDLFRVIDNRLRRYIDVNAAQRRETVADRPDDNNDAEQVEDVPQPEPEQDVEPEGIDREELKQKAEALAKRLSTENYNVRIVEEHRDSDTTEGVYRCAFIIEDKSNKVIGEIDLNFYSKENRQRILINRTSSTILNNLIQRGYCEIDDGVSIIDNNFKIDYSQDYAVVEITNNSGKTILDLDNVDSIDSLLYEINNTDGVNKVDKIHLQLKTEENQQGEESTPQPKPEPEPQQEETTSPVEENTANQGEPAQEPSNLPTGDESNQPVENKSEPALVINTADEEKGKELRQQISDDIDKFSLDYDGESQPIDLNAIREKIIEKYCKDNPDSSIRQIIEEQLEWNKKCYEEQGNNVVYNAIVKLKSSLRENQEKNDAKLAFNEAADKLIEKYAHDLGEKIDGTYYINLESLLRWCNKVAGDSRAAEVLFEQLYKYISNSKLNYKIANTNPEASLINSKKSYDVRDNEFSKIQKTFSTGLNSLISYYRENGKQKELQQLMGVLDAINVGDSVTYNQVFESGKEFISFEVNGVCIGKIPLPKAVRQPNGTYTYTQVNDGWITDIAYVAGNQVSSKLCIAFKQLIAADNERTSALYNLVSRYSAAETEEKTKLAKEMLTNKNIKSLIDDYRKYGYIADDATNEELLNGLSKLFKYTKDVSFDAETDVATNIERRQKSVEKWFLNKVEPSFNLVINLKNNPNYPFQISNIREGEFIRATDEFGLNIDNPNLQTVTVGLTEDNKNKAQLTVIGYDEATHQKEAIMSNVENPEIALHVKPGRTFISVPRKNGKWQLIQAYSQRINSGTLGSEAKAILNDVAFEIKRICELEITPERSAKDKALELKKFFDKLICGGDNITTLLTSVPGSYFNVKFKTDKDGNLTSLNICAGTSGNLKTLTIFCNGNDFRYSVIDNTNANQKREYISNNAKLYNEIIQVLKQNTVFNLGINFLKSDKKNVPLNGFASRKDGKFIITIPNRTPHTFDSYNAFIINQNIVKVNCKVEHGSNYRKRSSSGFEDYKLEISPISPVGNNIPTQSQQQQTPSFNNPITQKVDEEIKENEELGNKVTTILTDDKQDKAYRIAEQILDVNKLGDKGQQLLKALLPENVEFVDKDINDNAIVSLSTGKVTLGHEWLSFINGEGADRSTHEEAVRKLIHEKLHILLHKDGNEQLIEQLREIFDEFAATNPTGGLTNYLYKSDEAKYYKDGKINTLGLEEFLVETLTSKELAEYLNSKDTTSPVDGKKKSIFQTIMDFLAKLMGIDIREGSIYDKEFKLLGDVFSGVSSEILQLRQEQEISEVGEDNIDILKNATVIWAHPTQGKTSLYNSGREDVIDFDTVYTPELAKLLGEDETIEKKDLSQKYNNPSKELKERLNCKTNDEVRTIYRNALEQVFQKAEDEAKQNGKKLLISDMQLLRKFGGTEHINAIITKSSEAFYRDILKRGETLTNNTLNWKQSIDNTISRIDKSKVITSDKYLGEILPESNKQQEVKQQPTIRDNSNMDDYEDIDEMMSGIRESGQGYTPEMQEIKAKAIADGTFMKAPNGNLTNLTERQWLQVRTKAFKDWFGDWKRYAEFKNKENLTELEKSELQELEKNVSKVVDENGEPLVVYHAGNENINIFSRNFDKQGIGRQFWGKGFYFSGNNSKLHWAEMFENKTGKQATIYDVFLNIKNPTNKPIKGDVIESKNDGVILLPQKFYNGDTDFMYIVGNPNQIKSATDNNGEFSRENNDIRSSSIRESKEILDEEQKETLDIYRKSGKPYFYLNENEALSFNTIVEKSKGVTPKIFKVTRQFTKYERAKDEEGNTITGKFNPITEYTDYYLVKTSNNKKSTLYNIVNKDTGEIIGERVRVISTDVDITTKIKDSVNDKTTGTKVFSPKRSVAFQLYKELPNKSKFKAIAKQYLFEGIKLSGGEEINFDILEKYLDLFPEDMWNYVNVKLGEMPEKYARAAGLTYYRGPITCKISKLGLIKGFEEKLGIKLQGTKLVGWYKEWDGKRYDGKRIKTLNINNFTRKRLQQVIVKELYDRGILKYTDIHTNIRKYVEHKHTSNYPQNLIEKEIEQYEELFKDMDTYDNMYDSMLREEIRTYPWEGIEILYKIKDEYHTITDEYIEEKFKDKTLANGSTYLDYFFNGTFLEILYDRGRTFDSGTNTYLDILFHEPFHALHALTFNTKPELELRDAFVKLSETKYGKELLNEFADALDMDYNDINGLYTEFVAYSSYSLLLPKGFIDSNGNASGLIYDYINKIKSLTSETVQSKGIKVVPETITENVEYEEKVTLNFFQKLFNCIVSGLHKIIPISKNFIDLINDSIVKTKQVEKTVYKTEEYLENVEIPLSPFAEKDKQEFLKAVDELENSIYTLINADERTFDTDKENIRNFFNRKESMFNDGDVNLTNYKQKITSFDSFLDNFSLSLQSEILNDVENGEDLTLSCSL